MLGRNFCSEALYSSTVFNAMQFLLYGSVNNRTEQEK